MADEDLKARLKEHSKAFEGLMSLIPAEYYYGKDNSDQWQRTKQTKEEKRAAKMAKLAPGANKTALDVHREREQAEKERKRKREEDDAPEGSATGGAEPDSKKQKTDEPKERKSKNKKNKIRTETAEEEERVRQEKAERRREKNRRKKEERKKQNEKKRERRHSKKDKEAEDAQDSKPRGESASRPDKPEKSKKESKSEKSSKKSRPIQEQPLDQQASDESDDDDEQQPDPADDYEGFTDEPIPAHEMDDDDSDSSAGSSPEQENLFDTSANHSSASSSSSVVPPSNPSDSDLSRKPANTKSPNTLHTNTHSTSNAAAKDEQSDEDAEDVIDHVELPTEDTKPLQQSTQKAKKATQQPLPQFQPPGQTEVGQATNSATGDANTDNTSDAQMPKIDREALTQRLADKLAQLRAARKADGPDGKPAKNRAELIEARRRKAELQKQRKKEQKAKERESENVEEEAARLRGGNGSPLWSPSLYSPGGALANEQEPNFQFGKVAFDDGAEMDAGSGTFRNQRKKGKSDAKTALLAAEKKKARLAGYDADKRANIEEKDAWAAARNRVAGEKGKDDTSLLKRTIKRQQKMKGKSEKEWNERIEGVKKGQEKRQQKREQNLQQRKELKGVKGKDRKKLLGKMKGGGVQKKKAPKRPGFEGTFKTAGRKPQKS